MSVAENRREREEPLFLLRPAGDREEMGVLPKTVELAATARALLEVSNAQRTGRVV